jgi:hypothetical protein
MLLKIEKRRLQRECPSFWVVLDLEPMIKVDVKFQV